MTMLSSLAARPAENAAPISIFDARFEAALRPDSHLLLLFDECSWAEGPVWWEREGVLIWSDIENNRILQWKKEGVSVLRQPSHFANGNAVDGEGRLVHCEHGRRAISRTERDGTVTLLVDRYEGKRLNSPNDLVVAADGAIWFSDPTYGIQNSKQGYPAEPELAHRSVYRFDPANGSLERAADFDQPNGLAFSPDGNILYISDTARTEHPDGNHHLYTFDVEDGRRLRNKRVFQAVEPGVPDGLCVDARGWIYTSSASGVQVFSAEGDPLALIPTPELCANCTFGGADGSRLFITASTSLYAIDLQGAAIAGNGNRT